MFTRHSIAMVISLVPFTIAHAEHYEVYILAGQSNAGGHGYVSRDFAYFSPQGDDGLQELSLTEYLEEQPDALFIHWRGGTPNAGRPVLWEARTDGWIPMKAGYSLHSYNPNSPQTLGAEIPNHPFGLEVTFAKRIREGRPGRKVAIIKYSQGATGFGTTASPGAWDPATGRTYQISSLANAGHCYAGLLQLVNESLQSLTQQGNTHEIRGILWHQGEADSGLSTAVYKDRLKEFITSLRSDLGKPDLPFLIGELIQSTYANTRTAQQQAATETSNTHFISSVALTGDSTTIHFDTRSLLDFGRRFAERMLQSGPSVRRTIAHWKLDEPQLLWNNGYNGISDAVSGTNGVFYGYSENEETFLNQNIVNRDGPEAGNDRAYDFTPDTGISGINTLRPDAIPATGDFTLLVWMKTNDPHTNQGHLFSNNNGQTGRANLHLQNGSLTWFHNGGITLSEPNSPIFDGKWHRVGVMRKGNQWSLLRDGHTVATGNSPGPIGQNTEWMIGRMRAFNGNYEGLIGDVKVVNHSVSDPFQIESSSFLPGGECQLTWASQPGFEYRLEWSPDLAIWSLLGIVSAANGTRTSHSFLDPGNACQLFLRVR
jgi:hypothetical protein